MAGRGKLGVFIQGKGYVSSVDPVRPTGVVQSSTFQQSYPATEWIIFPAYLIFNTIVYVVLNYILNHF